jgi:hypothetical protein
MKLSTFALASFAVASTGLGLNSASAQTTLYTISSMILDGAAGENTYGISGGATNVGFAFGGANTTVTVSNTNQNSTLVGNFSDTALSVGDILRLSFAFTASGNSTSAQNIRFGFLNSNNTPFTANAQTNGTVGINDSGYFARYTPTSTVNAGDNYNKRDGTTGSTATLLTGTAPPTTSLAANITTTAVGTFGVPVTGFFQLERTASGVLMSSQLGGSITSSFLDTTSPFTVFNEVGFFFNGNVAPSFAFTDFSVVFSTSAIPEPSTYSAVAGLAVLGFVAVRRRRGAR